LTVSHLRPKYVFISKRNFSDLSTRSFQVVVKGKLFQGFVVKKGGRYFAYQNLCQHLPITLDLRDSDFFTHDKQFLQCHMHGAMYEVETGFCIAGPCQGARLVALELQEEEGRVVISIPESF